MPGTIEFLGWVDTKSKLVNPVVHSFIWGGNFGHTSLKLTIPVGELSADYRQKLRNANIPFKEVMRQTKVDGKPEPHYEIYYSFWPAADNKKAEPHRLTTANEDINLEYLGHEADKNNSWYQNLTYEDRKRNTTQTRRGMFSIAKLFKGPRRAVYSGPRSVAFFGYNQNESDITIPGTLEALLKDRNATDVLNEITKSLSAIFDKIQNKNKLTKEEQAIYKQKSDEIALLEKIIAKQVRDDLPNRLKQYSDNTNFTKDNLVEILAKMKKNANTLLLYAVRKDGNLAFSDDNKSIEQLYNETTRDIQLINGILHRINLNELPERLVAFCDDDNHKIEITNHQWSEDNVGVVLKKMEAEVARLEAEESISYEDQNNLNSLKNDLQLVDQYWTYGRLPNVTVTFPVTSNPKYQPDPNQPDSINLKLNGILDRMCDLHKIPYDPLNWNCCTIALLVLLSGVPDGLTKKQTDALQHNRVDVKKMMETMNPLNSKATFYGPHSSTKQAWRLQHALFGNAPIEKNHTYTIKKFIMAIFEKLINSITEARRQAEARARSMGRGW